MSVRDSEVPVEYRYVDNTVAGEHEPVIHIARAGRKPYRQICDNKLIPGDSAMFCYGIISSRPCPNCVAALNSTEEQRYRNTLRSLYRDTVGKLSAEELFVLRLYGV